MVDQDPSLQLGAAAGFLIRIWIRKGTGEEGYGFLRFPIGVHDLYDSLLIVIRLYLCRGVAGGPEFSETWRLGRAPELNE